MLIMLIMLNMLTMLMMLIKLIKLIKLIMLNMLNMLNMLMIRKIITWYCPGGPALQLGTFDLFNFDFKFAIILILL